MSAHPANPSLRRPSSLRGTLTAPGDKSVSHRSLLLNALGIGRARVTNFVPSADCLSTMRCLQALGVTIERHDDGSLTVEGRGRAALAEAADVLDCGNSGTTLRLLAGVLAGCPFFSVLTGDASLRSRPMGRIVAPLTAMGARIGGRADDSRAPLAIRGGALQGIEWRLPVSSAQIKSAVLLAGLAASGPTTALSPEPSRDHTERMLRAMGADLRGDGVAVTVHPATAPLRAVDVVVPGDVSSAAYWLAAGCAHPDAEITVRDVGVNPTRTGLLDVLAEMGARIERTNEREVAGEPIADLTARSAELRGVEVGGALIPRLIDELPLVAVLGAVARGRTVIRDAAELRVKETDRIATVASELRKLGATVAEYPDGLAVEGPTRLRGAAVESHGDHRLAMCLAVAGLLAEGQTHVGDPGAAAVSYPTFWNDLARVLRTER